MPPVPPKGDKVKPKSKSSKTKTKSAKGRGKNQKSKGPLDDEAFEGLKVEEIVLGDDETGPTAAEAAKGKQTPEAKAKGKGKVKDEL